MNGWSSTSCARPFIVVGEAVALVPDLEDAAVEGDEVERRGLADGDAGPRLAIGWLERLGGEQREDVGEQELLMLLLVIDAELDQSRLPRAASSPSQSRTSASSTKAR